MGEIVDINEAKRRLSAKKGLSRWSIRFRVSFDENTSIRQLDDPVIGCLAQGSEDSSMALYELIMGIKGLGPGPHFDCLDIRSKMHLTDITIFLLDLCRFEVMYRLGWVDDYLSLKVPLVDLILDFKDRFSINRFTSPALSSSHPLYPEYLAEFEGDRNVFLRKLIPEAIKTFCDEGL